MTRDRILLLILAGAFLTLSVETRFYHAGVWENEPFAYVPPVTAILSFFLCLLALGKKYKKVAGILMAVLSLTGVAGLYFHTKFEAGAFDTLLRSNLREQRVEMITDNRGMAPDEPPVLAPLGYTGLLLVGSVVCLARNKRG